MITKRIFRIATVVAGLLLAGTASAGCFTVYNGKGQLLQRTADAPINMRPQLRQTLPRSFGKGSSMVFNTIGETCSDFRFAHSGKGKRRGAAANSREDTDAILTDLVRSKEFRYGGGRDDTWVADVNFKGDFKSSK